MLEAFLELGDYLLTVDDSVTDSTGRPLDGEWLNSVTDISGDGAAGGDFVFHFRVLPGDVNQDGAVTVLDFAEIRDRLGATSASPNYNIFHDIDRRGTVDAIDFMTIPRGAAFTSLPPISTSPSGNISVPEPHTAILPAVGLFLMVCERRRRWC
jgi:hypothetical protein